MDAFDNGWDARAVLVEGRWVDRTPRRPEIEPRLRRETRLMPWLAPQLPLPVAVATILDEAPLRVRHELIAGSPCTGLNPRHAEAVGTFLTALHRVDPVGAVALGVPDVEASYHEVRVTQDRFRRGVIPMLGGSEREAAESLLDRTCQPPQVTCLVHSDLGPDHIRVVGDRVTGIIDWMDACIGDPAIDLSWVLYGTSAEFADAVGRAYGVDDELAARAHDWHLLGPWHEVVYGADTDQPHLVRSGLAGIRQRLNGRSSPRGVVRGGRGGGFGSGRRR